MARKILGLDLGSSSIGWALLQEPTTPTEPGAIIAAGVRVFPEGVDRDTKGLEKSKNVQRREARGARKTKRRRKLRRSDLVESLRAAGLLPSSDAALQTLLTTDPYPLRAKGLDHKLEPFEFGRVLFHLNQRRGFKSNRKSGKAKEDGTVLKEIGDLRKEIETAKCRTLGEYFAHLAPKPGECPGTERIRDRYTLRAMYEEEFQKLWNAQQPHHPRALSTELHQKLKDNIIFFQRPLKLSDDKIGFCELEENERRCPKDRWEAQQFVMLQEINHLRSIDNSGESEIPLTPDERRVVIERVQWHDRVETKHLYKALKWSDERKFTIEREGKRTSLKGNAVNCVVQKALGEDVAVELSNKQLRKIGTLVSDVDDDAQLKQSLIEECRFSPQQADAILKASAGLPEKYLMVSLKAIDKMLPFLEHGSVISDAKEKAGYKRRDQKEGEDAKSLPLPLDKRNMPLTNNPVVQKALFEVRKVVNAVLRDLFKDGKKPDEFVLELARDTRGSIEKRNDQTNKMRDRERERQRISNLLKTDFGIERPRRDDILKFELWLECNKTCPYTGKPISERQLFRDGEVQIEHILPYSVSLDDSFLNKTLCFVDENRRKGNTLPSAYYTGTAFDALQIRISKLIGFMPFIKRRKFTQKEINTDECIARQLNDTRYINTVVREFLLQLCPKHKAPQQYVRCARGDLTAKLRRDWGLESVLDTDAKNREDHRHHAVDAVVVALTSHTRLLQLTANDSFRRERGLGIWQREPVQAPWENSEKFRQQVKDVIARIVVSHKATRKVRGPLHEETFYGKTATPGVYAVRKPILALTKSMIESIRDPVIKEIIRDAAVFEGTKIKFPVPPKMKSGVLIRHVRISVAGQNLVALKPATEPKKFVETGSNHHLAVFKTTDKKGKETYVERIVTLFEAIGKKSIERVHPDFPDAKFVFSICKNDTLEVTGDDGKKSVWYVQSLSQSDLRLRPHTYAGDASVITHRLRIRTSKFWGTGVRKVVVDVLGRISYAHD